jgi:hypothetical protein
MRQAIPRDGHRRRERPEKADGKNVSKRSTFHPGSLSVSSFVSIRRAPLYGSTTACPPLFMEFETKVDARTVLHCQYFHTLRAGCRRLVGDDTLR